MIKLAFAHIPKTTGTSIFQLFSTLYPPDSICPARFDASLIDSMILSEQYKFYGGHYSFSKVKLLADRGVKIISTFRDPVDRQISNYRYWSAIKASSCSPEELKAGWYLLAAMTLSPEEYFCRRLLGTTYFDNVYVRYLTGFTGPEVGETEYQAAVAELGHIDFPLLAENVDADLPIFVSHFFKKDVVVPRANRVDMNASDFADRFRPALPIESCDSVRDWLRESSDWDYKLMQLIRTRSEACITNLRALVPD